jgi:type II secretory pathway pseudopilin PulG
MRVQKQSGQERLAMTLVELLVLIFVIGLLLAFILPISPPHRRPARRAEARVEIAQIIAAVEAYEAEYHRLPLADSLTNEDVTCGIDQITVQNFTKVNGVGLIATNSDLIVVLMDLDLGANAGHKLNPKRIMFLYARMVDNTNSPGVSTVDRQFRDPWGNPYIISLDANHDGFVRDACYARASLWTNVVAAPLTNSGGIYELSGKAMAWSRGPDGKVSLAAQADNGVNKDNVTGWR